MSIQIQLSYFYKTWLDRLSFNRNNILDSFSCIPYFDLTMSMAALDFNGGVNPDAKFVIFSVVAPQQTACITSWLNLYLVRRPAI